MKFVGLFFVSIMLMNLMQLTGFAGDRDLEGSEGDTKFNVYYGSGAGASLSTSTGDRNAFFGYESGAKTDTGKGNTCIGYRAGYENTKGTVNTFIGHSAGYNCVEGDANTFVGVGSGYSCTEGSENTSVGHLSGNKSTGTMNTYIGKSAGEDNNRGSGNTFVGSHAGKNSNTGYKNTFLGKDAGFNATGNGNVFLGIMAGFDETGSNKLYISNGTTSEPLIWGDFGTRKVVVYGGFRAIGTYTASDGRLKENVKPLKSALDKVSRLQGISYEWRTNEYPDMGFTKGKHIGLVAQDMEDVLPELVSEDKDGYKGISYNKLTAVLVEAIKALKKQNEKQQIEIEELRSIIKELES